MLVRDDHLHWAQSGLWTEGKLEVHHRLKMSDLHFIIQKHKMLLISFLFILFFFFLSLLWEVLLNILALQPIIKEEQTQTGSLKENQQLLQPNRVVAENFKYIPKGIWILDTDLERGLALSGPLSFFDQCNLSLYFTKRFWVACYQRKWNFLTLSCSLICICGKHEAISRLYMICLYLPFPYHTP